MRCPDSFDFCEDCLDDADHRHGLRDFAEVLGVPSQQPDVGTSESMSPRLQQDIGDIRRNRLGEFGAEGVAAGMLNCLTLAM